MLFVMLQVGFKACGEATFEDVSLTDLVSKSTNFILTYHIILLRNLGVDRL